MRAWTNESAPLCLVANCQEPPLVRGEHDLLHVRLRVGGEDGAVGEVPHVDLVSLGQDQRLPVNTQSCRRYLDREREITILTRSIPFSLSLLICKMWTSELS